MSRGEERVIGYNQDVRPILSENCFFCHGFDKAKREADLRRPIAAVGLAFGPWYVSPDLFLVTGEALIRNLQRGLRMAQIGLRDEGRREWNFTLRGMSDRQLLAAAEMACQAADWHLCINTSERTREQIDLRQRYPMPYRDEIARHARA